MRYKGAFSIIALVAGTTPADSSFLVLLDVDARRIASLDRT